MCMPCLCLARIYLDRACPVRTLPAPRRARPLPHTNGPPQDNCPGLRTVSPIPTALPVAPAAPPWSTTCAPLEHPCSRLRLRRAPWPNEAALLHFPALRLSGSTRLLSPDRRPPQNHART